MSTQDEKMAEQTTQGGMVARFLTPDDEGEWAQGLRESREGTWLQWLPWLRCAGRYLGGFEAIILERTGHIVGGVAGAVSGAGAARHFHNVYFTAYHGLWVRDSDLAPSRVESLLEDIAGALVPFMNAHFQSWAFSSAPELMDARAFKDRGCAAEVYQTYRVPLDTAEGLLARLDKSARRWVKHAEKAGTTWNICTPTEEELEAFEDHMRSTARRQEHAEDFPNGFFKEVAVAALAEGRAQMFIAHTREGIPATSLLCTWDEHRAYSFLGGNSEHMRNGEPRFLDYHAMSWLTTQGHREVDLLGGNIPALRAYKKQFNGVVVPYLTITGGRGGAASRGAHLRAAAKHALRALRG